VSAPVRVSWDQVLAWRMTRQFLDPPGAQDAVEVARRLCGVQAQVASAADLAVAVRQAAPRRDQVAEAIAERRLLKTWAMRGALHLLPADEAAAYLAVMASAASWRKPSWQRAFVNTEQLDQLAAAVTEALADGELTEHLRSG
jgi:N-acetylglucosamine kinase-like BadF-type ATPase